jgi:hypothetical protein
MPAEQLIFTDWPRGKGVDPAASGLQIVACSEGLTTEARGSLLNLSMHLGQAYSMSNAPRAAVQLEQTWLAQTMDRTRVPQDVLDAFPVIWSYDQLGPDQVALTRAQYTGFTHDGRTGNFFVHALVFDPAALEEIGDNPLALSRSGVFRTEYHGSETTLPTVANLAPRGLPLASLNALAAEPYREYLAALVSALCSARRARRPVLICLADWRTAAPLAEALLDLVPPAERRLTTFSTYESDRTWVQTSRSGRRAGAEAAHQLIILCGPGDRSWNLRADEYQSVYAVFDFVEGKVSALGSPRPFAAFAAARALEDDGATLGAYYQLLDQLNVSADPDAWDRLTPAAYLSQGSVAPDVLEEATRALASVADRPPVAAVGLGLLLPHVEALAHADSSMALVVLAPELATLLSRLSPPTVTASGVTAGGDPAAVLQTLADQAVAAGRVQTAAALLKAFGAQRDSALLTLLEKRASQPAQRMAVPSSAHDAAEWIHLLLDALRLVEKQPAPHPPVEWLVLAVFHAGQVSKQSAAIWAQLGESLVKRQLEGAWNQEKEAFAKKLVHELPPLDCPEGSAWLNLKLLRETRPQGSDLDTRLVTLTQAGSRSSLASEVIPEVIRAAQKQWEDPERRAIGLGRMAEAAFGTASQRHLETVYHEALKEVRPNQVGRVRRKLAEADAVQLLCKAFYAEVLPWSATESPSRLQHWYGTVFVPCPSILDGVLQATAGLVQDPKQRAQVWPLAEEFLFKHGGKATTPPGQVTLCNAVAIALPMAPLPAGWDRVLAAPTAGLTPAAQARLRVLGFMRQVEQSAAQESWSPAAFPADEPAWRNDVNSLPAPEKHQLLSWCANLFTGCGVTRPEDARAFVTIWEAADAGSPSSVASAVERLLAGRDPVTAVLVLTAFAACALEEPRSEFWTQVTKAIAERFDRDKKHLFVAHLHRRFVLRDPQVEQRQETLLIELGLAAASSTQTSEQAVSEALTEQKKPVDLSGVQQISARFKEKLKWGQSLTTGKQNQVKPKEPKQE